MHVARNALWGSLLIVGLLAHSFDLLLYNEETLVALCFIAFCGAVWYGAGESLGEALRERGVLLAREWSTTLQAQREAWQTMASPWQEAHRAPEVLQALGQWTLQAGAAGLACGEARLRAQVRRNLVLRCAALQRSAAETPIFSGALNRLCAMSLRRGGEALRRAQLEGALAHLENARVFSGRKDS